MKKLPQTLIEKQESERAATIMKVTDAIIMLNSQGYSTRIKDIISVTGLSRSVFAKPHIRRILIEYGIVEPSDNNGASTAHGKTQRNVDMIIAEKDGYIDRLLFANEQLIKEIELLRGEVHRLTHRNALFDDRDF
jgi:hypothetical protein